MPAQMAGNDTRISIEPAAGRKADNDSHRFIAVIISGLDQIEVCRQKPRTQ